MTINLPKLLGKTYEQYRNELTTWCEVSDLDKNKRGIAVALSFPEQYEHKLCEKVFSKLLIDVKYRSVK